MATFPFMQVDTFTTQPPNGKVMSAEGTMEWQTHVITETGASAETANMRNPIFNVDAALVSLTDCFSAQPHRQPLKIFVATSFGIEKQIKVIGTTICGFEVPSVKKSCASWNEFYS